MYDLDALIAVWADEVVQDRKARIRSSGLVNTGELERSVRHTITRKSTDQWLVRIQYRFYGKFFDKGSPRSMKAGGKGYVTRLAEWVKSRGISRFNVRRPGGTIDQQARDVAWGIIKANRGGNPWKRRKWLNPVDPDIENLQNNLSEHLADVIVRDHVTLLTE